MSYYIIEYKLSENDYDYLQKKIIDCFDEQQAKEILKKHLSLEPIIINVIKTGKRG